MPSVQTLQSTPFKNKKKKNVVPFVKITEKEKVYCIVYNFANDGGMLKNRTLFPVRIIFCILTPSEPGVRRAVNKFIFQNTDEDRELVALFCFRRIMR